MKIGGLQKVSLIDYPGKISAVIFTQGCNFRCSYCHNPELVYPKLFRECIKKDEVLSFLENRRKMLDAVVITGGEPTLQTDLGSLLKDIKDLGFLTKLDTNGSNPCVLENLIDSGMLDYIAMDIKASLSKYSLIAGVEIDTNLIKKSIKIIEDFGGDYEFRTTYVKDFLDSEDLKEIKNLVKCASRHFIQKYRKVSISV